MIQLENNRTPAFRKDENAPNTFDLVPQSQLSRSTLSPTTVSLPCAQKLMSKDFGSSWKLFLNNNSIFLCVWSSFTCGLFSHTCWSDADNRHTVERKDRETDVHHRQAHTNNAHSTDTSHFHSNCGCVLWLCSCWFLVTC